MSRLGCLSVLPSYGNKGGGEGKEGSGPPSTPGSAGLPGGPGTPAPNTNFNNPGGQRFMYSSTPSTVTANSYTYSYTTPAAFVSNLQFLLFLYCAYFFQTRTFLLLIWYAALSADSNGLLKVAESRWQGSYPQKY